MNFNSASEVENVCWQLREGDYPRAQNRARINNLFNGTPPYSESEASENRITVNVNDLTSTRLSHDARSQFYSAFLKPGNYFQCRTDAGKIDSRQKWNTIVTKEMNKIMKRSLDYFECFRSKFAMLVLHGIGPSGWRDCEDWCPEPKGIEDVLIPANTLLTMRNLPFFALYHSFTAPELIRLTRGPKVDNAWNMPLVKACLDWVDQETMALMGTNWPEIWSPEKAAERVKGDGGFYVGDQVPTIDVWDFYYWNDDDNHMGWQRRMILDSWSTPSSTGIGYSKSKPKMERKKGIYDDAEYKDQFLYNPGDRKFADDRSEIIGFQFADLSAVAPFHYHSVRSLGFLLYALCHLQMRLRCKFNESVFEALMMYFRVKSQDEAERALKLDLISRGFIDESMQFIPAAERFQVNAALVELGLKDNQQLISDNSSSYVQNQNFSRDKVEKTKFQVMAEVNAMTSLVSAGLTQAYAYQTFEYREIFRRFCRKDSTNGDVRKFRAACLKQGVPDKIIVPEAWEQEAERVMGAGNKTLEMAISEQLISMRQLYDPEPQRQILRDVTLAITDDPARAAALVPEQPHISDSIHDAQLTAGVLMQGMPVAVKSGINELEYIPALLVSLGTVVKQAMAAGGMLPPDKLQGANNLANHIAQHIQILAGNKEEKEKAREFGDALGQLQNQLKAFAQRLQEAQKKAAQQNGQGGMDPKDQAKIQATVATAQTKQQLAQQSHAQKTAQRQIAFEQKQKQDRESHLSELQKERIQMSADLESKDIEAASNVKRNKMKSTDKE